jgi:hypothetical protein
MPSFNPLEHPIIFMEPVLTSNVSSWVPHIPFAYLLMDLVRPSTFVELGTHMGDSYCAFCQAVSELELPTRCTGIDTWAGDPQAGAYDASVLTRLRGFHDPRFGAFSTLLQKDFNSARPQFAGGSIDLLHIDGLHTYEAVKEDYEKWSPAVSDRGVIIFHDTQVRRSDFGVWRLWEQISAKRPHFEFLHGKGLGILAVGDNVPAPMLNFLEYANAQPGAIRGLFMRLGDRWDVGRLFGAVLTTLHQQEGQLSKVREGIAQNKWANLANVFRDPVEYVERHVKDVRALLLRMTKGS